VNGADDPVLLPAFELFARADPFDCQLVRVERFPSGTFYFPPEPPKPFSTLTNALRDFYPGCDPYGGAHDELVPHVGMYMDGDEESASDAAAHLPIRFRATRARLTSYGRVNCYDIAQFTIG